MSTTNPYDPAPADQIQKLKDSIIEELSPLGEVEVTGFITPLRGGYLMDGVKARIAPKGMAVTTVYDVEWDKEEKVVRYKHNGRRVDPPRRTYQVDEAEGDQETKPLVVDRVMNRLRQDVPDRAKAVVRKRKFVASIDINYIIFMVVLSLVIGGAFYVFLFSWMPWFIGVPLAGIVAAAVFLVIGGAFVGLTEKLEEKAEKKANAEWSKLRSGMFYEVFEDDAERSEFLTYLVELCEQKGLPFKGELKVRYDKAENPSYRSQVQEPVVEFQIHNSPHHKTETVVFNGDALFYYTRPRDRGDTAKVDRI